jgi:signal transduction histidine kinase
MTGILEFDAYLTCSLAMGEGLPALGLAPGALVGRPLGESLEGELGDLLAPVVRAGLSGEERIERRLIDGRWLEAHAIPKTGGRGGRSAFCLVQDVTDRNQQEEELRRSRDVMLSAHKMEAVARLAGGVAHEFNNLLTGIRGYTRLLLDDKPWGHPDRDSLVKINRAVERATGLVHQLLAFGRQEISQPRVLDLGELVRESADLLRSVLGEEVVLDLDLIESVKAKVDPRQLEQVMVNLALNAREAMPEGGMVRVAVERARLPGATGAGGGQMFAVITVADTGEGIPDEIRDKIFEPFFSTKPEGTGLGLGLSAAHGVMEAHGGRISVSSGGNGGAVIQLFIPAVEDTRVPTSVPGADQDAPARILVVDDDAAVREVAARILRRLGYDVTEAEDARAALVMLASAEVLPDLLLSDVVMPGMNGRELSEKVRALYPGIRILFMSAYTADEVILRGIQVAEVDFLPKPFTLESLAGTVREVLGRAAV